MLRIAIQAKGRLFEETMNMFAESSIKIEPSKRTLLVPAKNFPIEVLFLRDDDIPQVVASGIADVEALSEKTNMLNDVRKPTLSNVSTFPSAVSL